MRFKTIEERYMFHLRRERAMMKEFIDCEVLMAELLLSHYKHLEKDMPDDVYRAAAFFENGEYKTKAEAVVMLYYIKEQSYDDIPKATKETAFDILAYRFQLYGAALIKGSY